MPCRFAPLTSRDRPAVVRQLLGLDADDRVLRFNTKAPDDAIVRYCGRWDFDRDIVEGAWHDDLLIGVLHLPVFPAGDDLVGELGVSVAAAWRKRRIATRLTARTLDRCRQRGVHRVYINFLTRNMPMACLAHRFTGDLVPDGDETVATIRLEAAPGRARDVTP